MLPFDATEVALSGATLVEASAGTGKTHAISTLVVRLIAERGLPLEQVLVLTFTEAAAAELKSRVRSRIARVLSALRSAREGAPHDEEEALIARLMALGSAAPSPSELELTPLTGGEAPERGALAEARLEVALRQAGEAAISTIHGFCHRALAEAAFESQGPFEVELVPDLSPLIEEVVRDFWALDTLKLDAELLVRLRERVKIVRERSKIVRERGTAVNATELVSRAVADPALHVAPRVTEPALPNTQAFRAALREAREAFDLGALQAALAGVKGNIIKDRDKLLESIEQWLARDPNGALPRKLPPQSDLLTPYKLPLKQGCPPPTHPFFFAWNQVLHCFDHDERAYLEQVAAFITRLVDYARREVPRRKRERGVLSYDDLLQRLNQALQGPEGEALAARLRERFPCALIDEFQDTDALQWRIFKHIYRQVLSYREPSQASADKGSPADESSQRAAQGSVADEHALDPRHADKGSTADEHARQTAEPHRPAKDSDADEYAPDLGCTAKVSEADEHARQVPEAPWADNEAASQCDLVVFLIGDPKQAIYGFRGADLNVYLAATSATRPERRFTMTTNYRSDPALLTALNTMYGRLQSPFFLERVSYPTVSPREGSVERLTGPDALNAAVHIVAVTKEILEEGDLASRCADEVLHLLARGEDGEPLYRIQGHALSASDIGILTKTNGEAWEVQQALARHQIPCVVLGDQSVFEADDARELRLLLEATLEREPKLIKSALLTRLVGLSAHQVEALERDDNGWDQWVARFHEWHQLWASRGLVQMLSRALSELKAYERLLATLDGERRLTNLLHLMELLHTAARRAQLGPVGLLGWLDSQIRVASERVDGAEVRLERDERAVKITTIHKSKGLEYPVVLCPFLTKGRLIHESENSQLLFHDPERQGARTLLLKLDQAFKLDQALKFDQAFKTAKAHAETEHLQEHLRLLYVALTRARHRVILHFGPVHSHTQSALGYLLHPPEGDFTPSAAWLKEHLKPIQADSVDDMLEALEALQARTPGLLARAPITGASGYVTPHTDAAPLAARQATRSLDHLHRTASFSALTTHQDSLELDPMEGKDRDQAEPDGAPPVLAPELPLLSFPRGTKAGHFFHDLLEHHDFTAGEAALARLAVWKLTAHGYDPGLASEVAFGLQRALMTPLTAGPEPDSAAPAGLRLADISRAMRLDELEFHFPVGGRGEGGEPWHLHRRGLAEAFAAHPSQALHPRYAERVAALQFAPVSGFLKGYIDLVFRAPDGRFYLLDYKTNLLGDSPAAYSEAKLAQAMSHSHYYLQYHLYTLALTRYLAARLPGFEYERDFGGVFYLFLRGMAPELGPTSGVFFERPPRLRIEALSSAMRGEFVGGGGSPEHATVSGGGPDAALGEP